mgnify:CR=1 FL=1
MNASTKTIEEVHALEGAPVLVGNPSDRELTDSLLAPVLGPTRKGWLILVTLLMGGVGFWALSLVTTLFVGIGAWGNNIPIAWAFDITNFVWWIGIGHAGTLISAILLLFQQKWRTSINRFAEAMTLFAVAMAGLYPVLHLGRPWFAWWLFPYPSTNQIWPTSPTACSVPSSPTMWGVPIKALPTVPGRSSHSSGLTAQKPTPSLPE